MNIEIEDRNGPIIFPLYTRLNPRIPSWDIIIISNTCIAFHICKQEINRKDWIRYIVFFNTFLPIWLYCIPKNIREGLQRGGSQKFALVQFAFSILQRSRGLQYLILPTNIHSFNEYVTINCAITQVTDRSPITSLVRMVQ